MGAFWTVLGTFLAGGINALAGGGTVFSYNGLILAGLAPIVANATNAFALVPGSIGGAWSFRKEITSQSRRLAIFMVPAILGALVGAVVVSGSSNDIFKRVVPVLVLFATILFAFSKRINAWARARGSANALADGEISRSGYVIGVIGQFFIAFYGGYFGAGMGILMLSLMSIIGIQDLRKANGLKNMLAAAINSTAAINFFRAGVIDLPLALLGAVAALAGGYLMGRLSRRIPQAAVRGFVVVFGCVASAFLAWRAFV